LRRFKRLLIWTPPRFSLIKATHGPEYQAAKAIRNAIADADFVIAEGVEA